MIANRSFLRGLMLAALALVSSGCAAVVVAGAATAGVLYYQGALKVTAQAEPPVVAEATVAAFQELSIPLVSNETTALDAYIVGRNADGNDVKVSIEREGENTSSVSIRIGTFGDEDDSTAIWERIQTKL